MAKKICFLLLDWKPVPISSKSPELKIKTNPSNYPDLFLKQPPRRRQPGTKQHFIFRWPAWGREEGIKGTYSYTRGWKSKGAVPVGESSQSGPIYRKEILLRHKELQLYGAQVHDPVIPFSAKRSSPQAEKDRPVFIISGPESSGPGPQARQLWRM